MASHGIGQWRGGFRLSRTTRACGTGRHFTGFHHWRGDGWIGGFASNSVGQRRRGNAGLSRTTWTLRAIRRLSGFHHWRGDGWIGGFASNSVGQRWRGNAGLSRATWALGTIWRLLGDGGSFALVGLEFLRAAAVKTFATAEAGDFLFGADLFFFAVLAELVDDFGIERSLAFDGNLFEFTADAGWAN